MTILDMKKIEDAALTYYKHQQATREKPNDFAEMLENRMKRMEIFTNQIFSVEDVDIIKNSLGITEAFCAAFQEPTEIYDLKLFLVDFTLSCEALISAFSHTRYRFTVIENSIECEPY